MKIKQIQLKNLELIMLYAGLLSGMSLLIGSINLGFSPWNALWSAFGILLSFCLPREKAARAYVDYDVFWTFILLVIFIIPILFFLPMINFALGGAGLIIWIGMYFRGLYLYKSAQADADKPLGLRERIRVKREWDALEKRKH